MRHIPRSVLCDEMEVSVPDESGYGGEYADPVTVSHVRLERAESLAQAGYKLADGASGRIYVDALNSEGAFRIPVGSKVSLGGDEYQVLSVDECRAYGPGVHHWEVDVR